MSTSSPKRTRSQRVAGLALAPGLFGRIAGLLRDPDVLLRLGMCALSAIVMWAATQAWAPPFPYRAGYVPARDVMARVNFEVPNPDETRRAQDEALRQARNVYEHDPAPLNQLRAELEGQVAVLVGAKEFDAETKEIWKNFLTDGGAGIADAELKQRFEDFQKEMSGEKRLDFFRDNLGTAFEKIQQHGLIKSDQLEKTGNQAEIIVYPINEPARRQTVPVSNVRLAEVEQELPGRLKENLQSEDLVNYVMTWLRPNLPSATTLNYKADATKKVREEAEKAVPQQFTPFIEGSKLAESDAPMSAAALKLLEAENDTVRASLTAGQMLDRSLAVLGMYLAVFTLCGFYIFYRDRGLLSDAVRFAALLSMATMTVVIGYWCHYWQAEVIPLLLLGMTVAIVFNQELSLLITAVVALIVVFSVGQGLALFVILMAAAATAVLLVGQVRSRSKLIYVGLCAGVVAALTTVGVSVVDNPAFSSQLFSQSGLAWQLAKDAGRFGLWAIGAGFLMTGMLPFVESAFGVLTDISLLELGDVQHPLLQELVRRAPGTYNHSINVAAIAEAGANAIGARGLLIRVGAYFHDIGKMLKPQYFIENQGTEGNRHDTLLPAMSALIIIAHVKDGADLARQHHLPRPIIDFIQQHHGTTMLEYFYHRAAERSQEEAQSPVDESNYRYPGPKPQTKEAGILMLADAVESASRTLTEPTPSRIENLVHELVMKRLLEGQLDQCGLSLQEVHIIEESLVKSLNAVYHGRVKYPEQAVRTA